MKTNQYLFAIFQLFSLIYESNANLIPPTETGIPDDSLVTLERSSRQINESSDGENSFYFGGKIYRFNLNKETFDDSWFECDATDGLFPDENNPNEMDALADHVISLYSSNPEICTMYWIGQSAVKQEKDVNLNFYVIVVDIAASAKIKTYPQNKAKYYITYVSKMETFCSICAHSSSKSVLTLNPDTKKE
ncbi:unnamed protein product [Orchesella dallaii]|uniref:Uncharacterized protein n=1 Tax=Orchesella dallaii TaxID=48710 RepID=A0ABP1QCC8_9HEXA